MFRLKSFKFNRLINYSGSIILKITKKSPIPNFGNILVFGKFQIIALSMVILIISAFTAWKVISRPAEISFDPNPVQTTNNTTQSTSEEVLGTATSNQNSNSENNQTETPQASSSAQTPKQETATPSASVPNVLAVTDSNAPSNSHTATSPPQSGISQLKNLAEKIVNTIIPPRSITLSKNSLKFGEKLYISLSNLSFSDLQISTVYGNGEEALVSINQVQGGFEIMPVEHLKPGKYTLKITDSYGNNYAQDFSWGALALNVNKSIYTPNETAKISIAVLDELGEMVCDASVSLKIQQPGLTTVDLTTANGSIQVNPQCNSKKFSLIPDYEAIYQVKGSGLYELTLTASTKNGTYTISDSFVVQDAVPFDVERTSSTRIFPLHNYPVLLDITAKEDFEGKIIEKVPDQFKVIPLGQENNVYGDVTVYNDREFSEINGTKQQLLSWNIKLKKGQKIRLGYLYDSPDKSPDFYTLGELRFYAVRNGIKSSASDLLNSPQNLEFAEARSWQIAVDAHSGVHMLLFWDPANNPVPTGWSVVTTYDGRFPRGESVANVLTTGGNATHTPSTSSVALGTESSGRAAAGTNTTSAFGHTHGTPTVTVGAANNLPSFRSMQLIRYDNGIPSTIPANAIAVFDDSPGMPGAGWTRTSAQDNRMTRVNSSVATGGSDTHAHTLTWGALTAASGQITTGSNTNNQGATTNHTHTAPAATNSDSQSLLPPYIEVVLASPNSDTAVPTGMVAMFDGDPSAGWTIGSESGGQFYQKFIRGAATYNSTGGGASTHSHSGATSGVSGGASANARGTSTAGSTAAGNGHTHTVTASFNGSDNHTPEYVNVVYGEKVNVPILDQIHSRWRNDDGSETTATFRRSEDVAATADVGVRRRLRIEVSNEGTSNATSTTYRIEYGLKTTTCDDISSWVAIPASASTEDFELSDSTNLTDGNSTTDVASGLTNENSSFVAGQVKDTANQTTGISLTTSEFTELEYSIEPTSNTAANELFCFRVTNAGSTTNFRYTQYPELTVGDPNIDQKHFRFRNDDGPEALTTGNTLYFNPTGNGFNQGFTLNTGCTGGSEWDCVDDGSADTDTIAPTSDQATSMLTTAAATGYYTLADDALPAGSTVTQLDISVWADDIGNPNTSLTLGYCLTCDGANNVMGSTQAVNNASYTEYAQQFGSLSLSTTQLNNMQLVVQADGVRADISTVYIRVTYSRTGASWNQTEDVAKTNQEKLENIRLRFSVANTGNIAANRNFKLEYATKSGVSCGDDETFTVVPVSATTEHFEMTTSANFADGDATTTQLTATGSFSAGKMIEDPSNSSGTFSLTNSNYSEMEYNIQATNNATGSYCFKVTDNGTNLDTYTIYPELSMAAGAATKVIITKTNANPLAAGSCNDGGDYAFTLQLQDSDNNPAAPTQTTVVRLTTNSGGTFTAYSTAGGASCSSAYSNGDVSFNTSTNTITVYISDTKKSATNWVVTADDVSGDALTSDTENYTVNAGAVSQLVITLPGQSFSDGTGNSGTPTDRTAGASFNLTTISATDDYYNVNPTSTNYDNDTRTLVFSGPGNAPDSSVPTYTTAVQFTNGQSTTALATTLFKAETTALTVTDGGALGLASASFDINPGEISADSNDSTVVMDSSTGYPQTAYTVTITLKDTWRNPKQSVVAANISVGATAAATITQPSSATNASGITTGSITWTTTGVKTVDITISNVSLVQNDGSTADVDGVLDDTHAVTISIQPPSTGITSGAKIKSGTRLRTN